MFIKKIKLREQIKSGQVDPSLLITCPLFDHFRDSEALNTIAKRIELLELNQGDKLFEDENDQKYVYTVLFGEMQNNLRMGDSFQYHFEVLQATQQTELIRLNKRLYEYLLQEENDKSVRQIFTFLMQVHMFKNMSLSHLKQFSQQCKLVRINENRNLIQSGQIIPHGYILTKGTVKVYRKIQNNNVEIHTYNKRDPLLIYECLNVIQSDYTVITNSSCYLLEIQRKVLLQFEKELIVDRLKYNIQNYVDQASYQKKWNHFKNEVRKNKAISFYK